jgi:putative hydrolase of the HAD superfamily
MSDFPLLLEQAISRVQSYLDDKHLFVVSPETVSLRVRQEDHESLDYRSRPLEERLTRIFGLDASFATDELLVELCREFMAPIFARGRCYEDTLPTIKELRLRGLRTAIVSNTSWGSPAALWRDDIRRLGLDSFMDAAVFDRDVGWRKPAAQIFEFTIKNLGVRPIDCLFVGDEPKWDLRGPRAIGIEAVLIDRKGTMVGVEEQPIRSLSELLSRL